MANVTDSSVWRNLAVALGDGLAFGVGVKLAQSGSRPPDTASSELTPLLGRLSELERRIEDMSRLLDGPAAPSSAASGLNRKALESLAISVVNAVNTRLQAQTGRMEDLLAAFQIRLDQQDAGVVEVQASHHELAGQFRQQIEAENRVLDQRLAELQSRLDRQDAGVAEVQASQHDLTGELRQQIEAANRVLGQRLAELQSRLDQQNAGIAEVQASQHELTGDLKQQIDQRLGEFQTRLDRQDFGASAFETRIAEVQASHHELTGQFRQEIEAANRVLDQRLAEFQTRLDQQDAGASAVQSAVVEFREIQQTLAGQFSERLEAQNEAFDRRLSALHEELCQALSSAVDLAVEQKLSGLREHVAQNDTRVMNLLETIGQAVITAAQSRASSADTTGKQPQTAAPESASPSDQAPIPPFAEAANPTKLWRVPMVSSLLAAGGALALWHYL